MALTNEQLEHLADRLLESMDTMLPVSKIDELTGLVIDMQGKVKDIQRQAKTGFEVVDELKKLEPGFKEMKDDLARLTVANIGLKEEKINKYR